MGRIATPNAILKSRGSKKVRADEPEFSGGFGKAPAGLSGIALDTWDVTAKELEAVGLGSIVERTALECYCHAVAAFHQANKDIEDLGSVVQSERGYTRNPACLNQNAAMSQILKFAAQFGLTPASRSKVQGVKKEEFNPFSAL
jgi:P27 family predicted phage terminase small subunit